MLKKIIPTLLLFGVIFLAVNSPFIKKAVEEGPLPLVERVRDLVDQSAGESLADRVASSMKVDLTIQKFRKSLRQDEEKMQQFLWRYCNAEGEEKSPTDHKDLTANQQKKLCAELSE